MKKFYIPTPIYEVLPFIYVVCGILLFFGVEILPPKLVGSLMFLAGVLIIHMRVHSRYFGN